MGWTAAIAGAFIAVLTAIAPASAETLKLDELIARAEAANPTLAAMRSRHDASLERIPQASAFDDPMFTAGFMNVEVDNFAFDRIPMTSKVVGLSQKFPFYGKRGLREDAARYESEAVEAEYRERCLKVRSEVKKAYFELWFIKKAVDTVDRNMALAQALREVAQTRYSVGKGQFGDVLKAQLEETGLTNKRLELKKSERTMRAMLGALTGSDAPVAGEPAEVEAAVVGKDRDALVAMAVETRPSVKAADARIKKGDAQVSIAEKNFYPDITASVNYSFLETLNTGMEQSDRISAMITLNLPVWWGSKLKPGVREALATREMAVDVKDAEVNDIAYRVDSLLGELEQAERTMKLYKDVAIPQASESLDAMLAGYEVGKMDFMMLIDARRLLFDYELGYYRASASREKSAAELEAVVGGGL